MADLQGLFLLVQVQTALTRFCAALWPAQASLVVKSFGCRAVCFEASASRMV